MKIISPKGVTEKLGISLATYYRIRQSVGFPALLRLSPNRVGHVESELDDWALRQR